MDIEIKHYKADALYEPVMLLAQIEFHMLHCVHCDMKFCVLGVIEYQPDFPEYQGVRREYLNQVTPYCPYCGKRRQVRGE